jgi:hypothetical protein
MILFKLNNNDDLSQLEIDLKQFAYLTCTLFDQWLDLEEQDQSNESFKLISFIFREHFLNRSDLFYNELTHLNIEQRLNLLKLIQLKIDEINSKQCLDFLIKQSDTVYLNLNNLMINATTTNDLDLVRNHLIEIKVLASILSDFLISKSDNISYLNYAQNSNNFLFKNTCALFKETHENKLIRSLLVEISSSSSSSLPNKNNFNCSNLKIELVRLIGILVFNNSINQSLLVDFKCLDLIANSITIDMDNLFAREWSILALKHILDKLDLK